jgi:uncharacterized protein YndB with AHSA1/START domain
MDIAPFVEIRLAQRYAAPAKRVFDAWIDPAIAGRWLFATASRPVPRVAIDARAGGDFRFEDRHRGKDVVHAGRYLELLRPRHLVFTLMEPERPRDRSRVIVDIVPAGKGCELSLTHQSVLPDRADRMEGRWAGMLYGLATILGSNAGC